MIRKDYALEQITQLCHLSASSLLAPLDLITSDEHYSENLRLTIIGNILEQCLHFIISKYHRYNRYGYSSIPYHSTTGTNHADVVNIFETVAAFCHNKGLGHLVTGSLKKEVKITSGENVKSSSALMPKKLLKKPREEQKTCGTIG
jgi:hypothetical protein